MNEHAHIDWKPYYEREPELYRFVPEHDPTENLRVAFVESLFPADPIKSVLDAGCGDGHQCNVFAARAGRVVGMDIAHPRLQYARAHRSAGHVGFVAGELTHPPIKPRSFDLVTLVEVLEHMLDPVPMLRNVAALSRRYVLVTVPYQQTPLVVLCPHCLKTFPVDGHLQRFDEARFRATIADAGLRIVKLSKFFPPSAWENAPIIRNLSLGGKNAVRKFLQSMSVIAKDNAVFIGALCERQ